MSVYPAQKSAHIRYATAAFVMVAGLFACTSRASAGSVTLHFDQSASSSSVQVKLGSQTITGTPGPYYWHEVNPSAGSLFPNPTTTFCVELTQSISVGSSPSYSVDTLASHVTAAQATAISELYAGHFNTAWESTSFKGSDQSTAFQLALWAIIYDKSSDYNLTGSNAGNLKVTSASSTAISTAQSWLSTLSSQPSLSSALPNEQLVWLSSPSCQDQLALIPCPPSIPPPPPTTGVPAPPGLLMGLVGLGGCLLGRLRRRTATALAA